MERPAEFLLNQGFCGYHPQYSEACDVKPPQQIIVYNQDCYWQCFVFRDDSPKVTVDIVVRTKSTPPNGSLDKPTTYAILPL